jgi:hypothetical protein
MKTIALKIYLLIYALTGFANVVNADSVMDTLKYSISIDYAIDLSDTYDGGNLLNTEVKITKSWFGASISFGHFQSHSIFEYRVHVDELEKTLIIPFDEVSIMKTGSISLIINPIKRESFETELVIGFVGGFAKSSQFHDVEYSYSLQTNSFNYLFKNYELIKRSHLGYQVGLNIICYPFKKVGLQLYTRIQDLNNGGTFFFVGGGLCFRL